MNGIPLGMMASAHKFADTAMSLTFNARTFNSSFESGQTQGTLSTSLSAGSVGDIAIFWDFRINIYSSSMPTSHTPSGWTNLNTMTHNAGNEFRHDISYKILTSSDLTSTVTSGSAETRANTLLFFSPSKSITSVTKYDFHSQGTSGDAGLQTQNVTTLGATAPVIIFGMKATFAGEDASLTAAFTNSPSFDNTFSEQYNTTTDRSGDFYENTIIGYKIQNTTLSDLAIDANDQGLAQQMWSFHIEVD